MILTKKQSSTLSNIEHNLWVSIKKCDEKEFQKWKAELIKLLEEQNDTKS